MGTAASSPASSPKTRLEYLGDRYPFGDAELTRLARGHASLCRRRRQRREGQRQRELRQGGSFLSEWAVVVVGSAAAAAQSAANSDGGHGRHHPSQRAAARMQVVEGKILPSGFGHRLERAAFLLPSDIVVVAEDPTSSMSSGATTMENDNGEDHGGIQDGPDPLAGTAETVPSDASFQRLDKFLEGAAECCRRGSRPALTVLFRSCRHRRSRRRRSSGGGGGGDEARGDGSSTTKNGNGVDATGNGEEGGGHKDDTNWAATHDHHDHDANTNDPANLQVNAHEVLDLAYRLALAAALLAEAAPTAADWHEGDVNAHAYLPADGGTALAQSLVAHAQNRRHGYPTHLSTSTSTHVHVHKNENEHDHWVSLDAFLEWAEQTAPCLAATLSTFLHRVWFPDQPYPPSRTPFLYPHLGGQESAFVDHRPRTSPLLFALACTSPSLGGSWHRLYTSDSDGLSFNRLFASLLGYGGPTVLLVREAEGGGVFGAFTATAWKERKDFYGNSDCFLFRASPTVGVYRPRGRGSNYMYCNSVARSRGYDGLAHGIGFGGTEDLPRLFISETFDGCVASSADLTFDPGPLLPPAKDGGARKYFSICDLEVWGVGGDEAVASGLDARKAQRAILDANIQKARKVDKAQFLDDFKSGLIESKAFKHRTEARGRHDFEADDNDGRDGGTGYKIPPDKRGSTVVPGRTIPGTGL